MRSLKVLAVTIAIGLAAHTGGTPVRAQTPGQSTNYPAGLSLVAGPPGTDFSAAQGELATLQPGSRDYRNTAPASGTTQGYGYWVHFDAPTTVQLNTGSDQAYSTNVLAGQWVMIGDPSGTLPATVKGAAAVYSYDPASGYKAITLIQPGQGAWALSSGGGLITVAPQTPEALAAAGSLRVFSANGYQVGVPGDWDRFVGPRNPQVPDAEWGSGDGKASLEISGPLQLPSGAPVNAVKGLNLLLNDPKFLGNAQVAEPAKQSVVLGADASAVAVLNGTDPKYGPYREIVLLSIRNENLYSVDIIASTDYAAKNQALIDQVLQSFQFTP